MSRSDNTEPLRLRTGFEAYAAAFALPKGTGKYLRRRYAKHQRQQERAALRCLEEPEPSRPRHSVSYDYW